MSRCLVVADDLTGGNATGVRLSKTGLKTCTVLDPTRPPEGAAKDCDCLVCSVDSRGLDAKSAYDRVFQATRRLGSPDVRLYAKRIDSTLRGNLGSETDAMLDALNGGHLAVVAPCFPQANRILLGGHMAVNGIPLHRTEAAIDPKTPVTLSNAVELFRSQTKYPVELVGIDQLAEGEARLAEKIRNLRARGVRIAIFDCVGMDDLETIAGAVVASGVPFIAVDPGVFTGIAARRLLKPAAGAKTDQRIVVAVGSTNAVAFAQTEDFLANHQVLAVYMNVAEVLESPERAEAEVARVAGRILNGCDSFELCAVISEGIRPECRVPFGPYLERFRCSVDALSDRINCAIAEAVARLIDGGKNFSGVYSCGGDITVAVCRRLGADGIMLFDEVLPLAAYGALVGGPHAGFRIITKGGMVGDKSAIGTCIGYLRNKLGE